MIATEDEIYTFITLPSRLKKVAAYVALGYSTEEMMPKLKLSYWSLNKYMHDLRTATRFETTLKLAVFIVRHPKIERMLRESLN
jgi:hypothetical protein